MLKSIITDPQTGISAAVDNHDEPSGLIVATRPLKVMENSIEFFLSDEYGADMNVNVSYGGTPDQVHNGTDDTLWTGSDIVGGGKSTFNSTDQNHTDGGTKSIKIDNAPVNDIWQFAKGSDINCAGYTAISLWLYVDKDWKANDSISIYGWDTGTNTQVGNEIFLEDYFSYDTYDIWQKVILPLSDMGALALSTTCDALRMKMEAKEGAKAPKFYIDDIQFEQTGTPAQYILRPNVGTWLHVDSFTFSLVDAYPGTVLNGTMHCLPYNAFLGVTPTVGLTYQRVHGGLVVYSETIKSTIGLLSLAGTRIESTGSDGTNTFFTATAVHAAPFILKHENLDYLSFTVNDDLSGLLHMRINAACREEYRK